MFDGHVIRRNSGKDSLSREPSGAHTFIVDEVTMLRMGHDRAVTCQLFQLPQKRPWGNYEEKRVY
jgi:hypothetical protein